MCSATLPTSDNTRPHEANDKQSAWQLTALDEALGDLVLTVEESLTIGRGKDNDVVLGSKQVSRNHARLVVLNGKLYIKDLESSNGTFVNDTQIVANKSKQIQSDDIVSFATFAFRVQQHAHEANPQTLVTATEPVAKEGVIADKEDQANPDAVQALDQQALEEVVHIESASVPYAETTTHISPQRAEPIVDDTDHPPTQVISEQKSSDSSVQPAQPAQVETNVSNASDIQPDYKEPEPKELEGTVQPTITESTQHKIDTTPNPTPSDTRQSKSKTLLWAILIIVILALALWLFNTGNVV